MATTSPLRQRNRRHDDPQPLAGDPTILHLRAQKVQPAFWGHRRIVSALRMSELISFNSEAVDFGFKVGLADFEKSKRYRK